MADLENFKENFIIDPLTGKYLKGVYKVTIKGKDVYEGFLEKNKMNGSGIYYF